MVLAVKCHALPGGRFAAESAFCEHMRMMKRMLEPRVTHITVSGPAMSADEYARAKDHLGVIDESEGISFVPLHEAEVGTKEFWTRELLPLMKRLAHEVKRAELVHTGTSHNLSRPIEFPALMLGALLGKKTIAVVDIDLRNQAKMSFESGRWPLSSYLVTRGLYDPLRSLQMHAAARFCSLFLVKGRKLRDDYGEGSPRVKDFLDSAFSEAHIIPERALEEKLASLRDPSRPLALTYFGRLTAYKGVDRCIEAVALAAEHGAADVTLEIMGAGEDERALREQVARLGLEGRVTFTAPVPYGPRMFEKLYGKHVLLAAPLSEDTPRSALDAMAAGMPILAYDTYYYRDMVPTGAVEVVPWPSTAAMAEKIASYARNKAQLIPMSRAAVRFARENTQEAWLEKRVRWTFSLLDGEVPA